MARKRGNDNNVADLYDVENKELPTGASFSSKESIQSFVDFVTSTPAWLALGNVPERVRVFDNGDNEESHAKPYEIWLARRHWNTQVVLHELAHQATPKSEHGPAWVQTYLVLVTYFMGRHYADVYTRAFRRVGVKVS
jgi:putative metallohydrolase (TIGR04338 family)